MYNALSHAQLRTTVQLDEVQRLAVWEPCHPNLYSSNKACYPNLNSYNTELIVPCIEN